MLMSTGSKGCLVPLGIASHGFGFLLAVSAGLVCLCLGDSVSLYLGNSVSLCLCDC